jgi:hypothetical protein
MILKFWIFAVDFWKKLLIHKFATCGKLTRALLAHQIFFFKSTKFSKILGIMTKNHNFSGLEIIFQKSINAVIKLKVVLNH